MGSTHIAAIGPATAAALSQYGIAASIVPGEYVAESVVAALIDDAYQTGKSLQGQRILLARAAEARKVLVTGLQQAGAIVDKVAAYFTVSAAAGDERGLEVVRLLRNRQLDIITFTSSSTVRNFMQWLQQCEPGFTNEFSDLVRQARPKIACIGPITSQTAREFDLDVHIEAQEFTINGLVKAIIQDEETISDSTIIAQPQQAVTPAKPKQPRQLVRFTFYKLDPQWQLLPLEKRQQGKQELLQIFEEHAEHDLMRSYALYGLRSDCDFMLWQATYDVSDLQGISSKIRRSSMGPYLRETHAFLSMTKRSVYVGKNARGAHDPRLVITPEDKKYLFVYPFVKTRPWYALPLEERKRMMNEHIRMGLKYPSVSLNTTYSFGLDDQEFVVAFETDNISDFLDLVQELRETEASRYTLRDTPMFTCVAQPLDEILEAIGA